MINPATLSMNAYVMAADNFLFVMIKSNTTVYSDSKKFVADIPKIFKNLKAVTFNLFEHYPRGYDTNLAFCKAVKAKMDSIKIAYTFNTPKNLTASLLFFFANVSVNVSDTVLLLAALDNKLLITEYEFTETGFKELFERKIPIDAKEDPKAAKENIMGTMTSKKVIFVSSKTDKSLVKYLRKVLKSKKMVIFDQFNDPTEAFVNEISKWLFDKSCNKFYVRPTCGRNYYFMPIANKEPYVLLHKSKNFLPYSTSFFVPKVFDEIVYGDADDKGDYGEFYLQQNCHQNKITVNIDIENFIEVKHEAVIVPEIIALPKNLDKNFEKKIPVIGIFDETSVLCVAKDDGYKFANAWNGQFGKELAVSFDEMKPKFCDDAFQNLSSKPTFVVYDLMKILAMPADKIEVNGNWIFKVTEDENNPVLLEFDNFDGTKKAASPAFLFALLLKGHLKAVKEEIGKKPAEIGFCLFGKYKDEDEKKRVKEQLRESCNLLKIECVFVEF